MKKIIILWICFCMISYVMAQMPYNDSHWRLNHEKSDEFNQPTLDISKWRYLLRGVDKMGIEKFYENCVSIQNGYLCLKTEKVDTEYHTGGIKTLSADYSYGYYEISATIPKGKGFWTAFWLFAECWNPWPLHRDWYDEIDILEPNGCQGIRADKNKVGLWERRRPEAEDKAYGEYVLDNLPDLSLSEHRFAVEWLPNYVCFYFDDQPFNKFCNHFSIPSHPMHVLIDQQISADECAPDSLTDSSLPQFFSVNWFRYFELEFDCNTVIDSVAGNGFDFTQMDYRVKKSYSIGNTSVPPDSKVTLRATDTIEINGTFEVPLGSEFILHITPCY